MIFNEYTKNAQMVCTQQFMHITASKIRHHHANITSIRKYKKPTVPSYYLIFSFSEQTKEWIWYASKTHSDNTFVAVEPFSIFQSCQ